MTTRILLADDDPVARRGLRSAIEPEPGLEVVATASDGAEAVEKASDHDVDLALLDDAMPCLTGFQAARELTRRNPRIHVLILCSTDDERLLVEALRAGAVGYVRKATADRDLVKACRAALRGEPFLYPDAVSALVRDYREWARSP